MLIYWAQFVENLPTMQGTACSAGDRRDAGSVSGLGRSPGRGNGNPLQYSGLGNPMDRGPWWASVHGVTKSQTWLSALAHYICLHLCVKGQGWLEPRGSHLSPGEPEGPSREPPRGQRITREGPQQTATAEPMCQARPGRQSIKEDCSPALRLKCYDMTTWTCYPFLLSYSSFKTGMSTLCLCHHYVWKAHNSFGFTDSQLKRNLPLHRMAHESHSYLIYMLFRWDFGLRL